MSHGLIIPGQKTTAPQSESAAASQRALQGLRDSHRAYKQEQLAKFEQLVERIKQGDPLPHMFAARTTLVTFPRDFGPDTRRGMDISVLIFGPQNAQLSDGSTADLIVYRTLDRQVAFGLWNGKHIAAGQESSCITMRPTRLIDHLLPDDEYASAQLISLYGFVERIFEALNELADRRDAAVAETDKASGVEQVTAPLVIG